MTIKFEKPTEAFLAIAAVVLAADKVGGLAERNYLFGELKNVDIFKGCSDAELGKLFGDVTQRIYDCLPIEDHCVTAEGLTMLLGAAQKVLTPKHKEAAYKVACGLACSDGECGDEKVLLDKIQKGLGLCGC